MDRPQNKVIIASKLTKIYNKNIIALNDIDLEVFKGITALIGPNGAGKTTFLKILLGLIKPSKGNLKVFDLDSWNDSLFIHNQIGVIHEKHQFPAHLSIQRYLEIIKHFYPIENKINVGSIINLPLDRKIGSLSAGMYRKLSLLQCFIGNPKLIVMDEPTANLDPIARKELLDFINTIHVSFKIDFIISSHILSDLENIATNVIVLNKGKVKFQGKYSDLITTFFSRTFELFVDNPKEWVNFLTSFKIINSIKDYENKIIITTTSEIESNVLLTLIYTSKKVPASNINIFRKVLDINQIFE